MRWDVLNQRPSTGLIRALLGAIIFRDFLEETLIGDKLFSIPICDINCFILSPGYFLTKIFKLI